MLPAAGLMLVGARPASAASAPTLDLKVLLIGEGSSDPTTAAWENALSSEGVPYTEVTASGTAPSETVSLPALSSGTTGNFNGVVITDDPADFASGQLSALDSYESTFGVRQVDGYAYPSASTGQTFVSSGALDGTTGSLTSAGLADFPELKGPIPFDTGTFGYWSTASSGAPFTPLITNAAGDVLAGIYQHPSTDAQAGVSELALNFDYNLGQMQWLLLAPGLINWVTQGTHLGLYRNYVEMDIDDTFTPDDAWDTTNHTIDYSDTDALRMRPADVTYAAQWSQANHFRMDQLFNYGSSVAAQSGDLTYAGSSSAPTNSDPLTAQFQATDPATGKSYANDFGWISHTYDTPYLDVGCATQNYIEAELNENTSSIAAAPGSTAGTGGLGIAQSDDTSLSYGTEDPQVFVPGNHSGFADLVPGNPATVDPPDLDSSTAATTTGATLAPGSYEYAVTDQFNASDSASTDQSAAFVTAPVTVSAPNNSVSLQWQSICHAANYLVYRAAAPYTSWSLVGSLATPASATLPDNSSGDPASTSDVTGGGELEQTFTDNGSAGTAQPGFTPPVQENANETPWEQNPYFIPALQALGITAVGDDASKPYPDPATATFGQGSSGPATYTGATYPAGATFVDGTAQVVPRHPINIYYNASTEAQELDEYNTLYVSTADGGQCQSSATTTCLTTPATFQGLVNQVVSGMFVNMLSNDPRPSYVHQTNLMGAPPGCTNGSAVCNAAPPSTPPTTPDTTGDGLLYSVLNPLLAQYNADFSTSTPYQQLTEGAIGTVLADQSAWGDGASGVSATEQNGAVTVTNSGTSSVNVPITAPAGTTVNGAAYGQAYGGTLSDWTSVAAGATQTLNENVAPGITSPASASSTVGSSFSFTVTTAGAPAPSLTETGTLPSGLTFTDNGDGTATIAGTPATGSDGSYPITITATNASGTVTQNFTLTNSASSAVAPTITGGTSQAITGATTAGLTVNQPSSASAAATGKPAATSTSAAVKAQVDSGPTQGSAWLAGATSLTSVITDSAQLSAAEQSGNAAAAVTAGGQLATAVGTALSGTMPPVDAAGYKSALTDLQTAGSDASSSASGSVVATQLLAGEMGLEKVTAMADTPVAAKLRTVSLADKTPAKPVKKKAART